MCTKCFNPRARDGREANNGESRRGSPVSIHAPVMDANWSTNPQTATWRVSIHAPVMDAKDSGRNVQQGCCFNPRARDGRENFESQWTFIETVSIHAPVMDANRSLLR